MPILPWHLYASMVETLEILEDQDIMEAFRRGVAEAEDGRGIPWENVKRELKL